MSEITKNPSTTLVQEPATRPRTTRPEKTQPARKDDNIQNLTSTINHPIATVILPAYNESHALPTVLKDLCRELDESYEIIVVDDGSIDNTSAVATKFPCNIIRHETNMGKGAAVHTGIQNARGDKVVVMDADATYPASQIPKLVELLSTYEFVRCTRDSNGEHMPRVNQIGNKIFDLILSQTHGLNGNDYLSGLYGLRRDILLAMDLESEGFDIEAEIGVKSRRLGLKETTFPIEYQQRLGEKKLKAWRDGWRILQRILLMFLIYNPAWTFVIPGVLIMLFSTIAASILKNNAIITPYFGLDVNSFILASLGVIAGFQIMVFGIAASLYAVEAGAKPRAWLILASSTSIRLGTAAIGTLMVFYAVIEITSLGLSWLLQGAGPFTETRNLVLSFTVFVAGFQLLVAALFISIFAGRLRKKLRKNHGYANMTETSSAI